MPSSAQVTTRSTNNNFHPGIVDQRRRRHTKLEMAAFRAEEAEKKLEKELEKQEKVNRIAMLEKALDDEVEATPHPDFKRKLRRSKAYLEIPVNEDSMGSEESRDADQDFEPTSGNEVTTESGMETEPETPPKKKKKTNKEPVRAAITAARSSVNNERTAKEGQAKPLAGAFNNPSHEAGIEVPHGGRVSVRSAEYGTNDRQIKVKR